MTHGLKPTQRCGITRAVVIAFQELGPEPLTTTQIVDRALEHASKPRTREYVKKRVLERGVHDGWIQRVSEDRWRLAPTPARMEARGERALERQHARDAQRTLEASS